MFKYIFKVPIQTLALKVMQVLWRHWWWHYEVKTMSKPCIKHCNKSPTCYHIGIQQHGYPELNKPQLLNNVRECMSKQT